MIYMNARKIRKWTRRGFNPGPLACWSSAKLLHHVPSANMRCASLSAKQLEHTRNGMPNVCTGARCSTMPGYPRPPLEVAGVWRKANAFDFRAALGTRISLPSLRHWKVGFCARGAFESHSEQLLALWRFESCQGCASYCKLFLLLSW